MPDWLKDPQKLADARGVKDSGICGQRSQDQGCTNIPYCMFFHVIFLDSWINRDSEHCRFKIPGEPIIEMKPLGGSSFTYGVHMFFGIWERSLSWYSSPDNSESVWTTMHHWWQTTLIFAVFSIQSTCGKELVTKWTKTQVWLNKQKSNKYQSCHVWKKKTASFFAFRLWRGRGVRGVRALLSNILSLSQTSENLVVFDNGRVQHIFANNSCDPRTEENFGMNHWYRFGDVYASMIAGRMSPFWWGYSIFLR